jgi:hypothetical protein
MCHVWASLDRLTAGDAFILSTGHRDREAALAQVQSLTEHDQSDGWEPISTDWFRASHSLQEGLMPALWPMWNPEPC